jgi:transposase
MATVLEEYPTEEQRFAVHFLWPKGLNAKDIHKEIFPVYDGKCLSNKAVHIWVEKFSQGRSKAADDARPSRPVETATEATVQRVEELIPAHSKMTIDSVATALGCSHGLGYSIRHDRLKFRKVCARIEKRMKRMCLSLQHLLRYADEGEDMLNKIVSEGES